MTQEQTEALRERIAELEEDLQFVERWAVHHGSKPSVSANEALSAIQHYPSIQAITDSYADGKRPDTFNPYARIAELEAGLAQVVQEDAVKEVMDLVVSCMDAKESEGRCRELGMNEQAGYALQSSHEYYEDIEYKLRAMLAAPAAQAGDMQDANQSMLKAVNAALEWWKEHQYDTTGDYGEWNVFDGEPDFVVLAKAAIAASAKGGE